MVIEDARGASADEEQDEDCEIDQLMLTAQEEYDQEEDETKRASCSQGFFVRTLVSRTIFGIAKAKGAKVTFASD